MKLLLFGITRDIVGSNELNFELDSHVSNVGELKNALGEKFPELHQLKSLAIAVNEEYATDEITLSPNDVVALIPPVSGG